MVGLRSLLADVELVFFETPGNAEVELRRMGSVWVRVGVHELARNSNQAEKVATGYRISCVHIRQFTATRPSAVLHEPRRAVPNVRIDEVSSSVAMHRASVSSGTPKNRGIFLSKLIESI